MDVYEQGCGDEMLMTLSHLGFMLNRHSEGLCNDLEMGYEFWREEPERCVGIVFSELHRWR